MELSVSLKMVSSENWDRFHLDDEFVDSILGPAISTLARSFERFVAKKITKITKEKRKVLTTGCPIFLARSVL